jgi:hypothetical protein
MGSNQVADMSGKGDFERSFRCGDIGLDETFVDMTWKRQSAASDLHLSISEFVADRPRTQETV